MNAVKIIGKEDPVNILGKDYSHKFICELINFYNLKPEKNYNPDWILDYFIQDVNFYSKQTIYDLINHHFSIEYY